MKVTEMRFVTREECTDTDKDAVIAGILSLGGRVISSRRDIDGGEMIELKVGNGKQAVKALWSHWLPQEKPALFVGSNNLETLAATLSALIFDDKFFADLSSIEG